VTPFRTLVGLALVPVAVTTTGRTAGPPIRLAVNMTTIESAPVFVAAERLGRAAIELSAGGIPELVSGAAELATNSETQALIRSVAHPDLRIVLTVAECYYRIVARQSAGIERVADLRRKKIGTPANTSAHYYLAKTLDAAKLSESDVVVVPMRQGEMAPAIGRGEVDAVSMWEPEAQYAIDALGADAIVLQDKAVYRELFNLNTTAGVLADPAKRSAVVDVVRAVVQASEQMRRRPIFAWPLLASRIGAGEPTISKTWTNFRFAGSLAGDLVDVLTEEERWVARGQNREPRMRPILQSLVDPSVLRDARSN
jgi:NitT/TauT family transport system substrate-binding protein